jgi:hypothetical protein
MDSQQKKFRDTSKELAEFFKRVGRIWIYEELMFLGIEPETLAGKFRSGRLHLLQEFCLNDPDFHIVSCQDYKIYNKYIPDANGYYLADGDNDPNLMVDLLSRLTADEFLQVGQTVLAPIVGEIKGSS